MPTNKSMVTPTGTVNLTEDNASSDNYNVDRVNANTEKIADAITALTNAISKKGWWTLINYEIISGADTFTTYNSRKISDYSGGLIVLSWLNEGLVRGTTIIPMTEFINGREVDVYHITTNGNRRWLAITRVSDTSIRISTNENAGVNKAFVCSILAN